MNESDYIGVFAVAPKVYRKLSKMERALIVEEYVNNKSNGLEILAAKYNSNISTISHLLTDVLFNYPKNPVVITLKSAV